MCGFKLTRVGQIHSQNLIHQLLHEIDNPISRCSHLSWYDHFQFEHQDEEGLPVEELEEVGRATLPWMPLLSSYYQSPPPFLQVLTQDLIGDISLSTNLGMSS